MGMNVVEINMYNFGSTGTIMLGVSERLREEGHRVMICYPATKRNLKKEVKDSYLMHTRIERNVGMDLSRLFGCEDLFFRLATWRLVRKMDRFGVDLVHLHNLHGWYINIPVLFRYLRKKGIPVVWTLHDCWPFTGHCAHFDRIGCRKWMEDCRICPLYRGYPQSRVDNARRLLRVKRKYITGLPGLTLAAPSEWLASLVRKSYLKDSPVVVVYNGIDTELFRPVDSDFRSRWHLEGKVLILGVAMQWGIKKGIDVFARLAEDLDDRFGIVLVGTDDEVDRSLPARIITIHRTMNQEELAAIYTTADLFVNPTREEVFGLVNVEALACGTPVLTYDSGGSPETIDRTCGSVVERDDYEALKAEILRITTTRPFSPEACRARALQLSATNMQDSYVRLFTSLVP